MKISSPAGGDRDRRTGWGWTCPRPTSQNWPFTVETFYDLSPNGTGSKAKWPKPCLHISQMTYLHRRLDTTFFKWAIPGLFLFIFVFSIQLTLNKCSINFADDWIRTADSGCGSVGRAVARYYFKLVIGMCHFKSTLRLSQNVNR